MSVPNRCGLAKGSPDPALRQPAGGDGFAVPAAVYPSISSAAMIRWRSARRTSSISEATPSLARI